MNSDRKEVPWVLAAKTGKIGFANRLDVAIVHRLAFGFGSLTAFYLR
jgi:hypothetical protein